MITPTSVIALFCEDIREEKSGAVSLVGVLGDNVGIPALPAGTAHAAGLMRLSVFVRINFDVETKIAAPVTISMRMPDGSLMPVASLDEPLIDEARRTREKGNPVAGMIAKLQMSGPIPGLPGRMQAEVTIGDQTYIAGTLKFEIDPSLAPIPATNVLPPPS